MFAISSLPSVMCHMNYNVIEMIIYRRKTPSIGIIIKLCSILTKSTEWNSKIEVRYARGAIYQNISEASSKNNLNS